MEFYLFFFSVFGMGPFCMLAAYGLREKGNGEGDVADPEQYWDEKQDGEEEDEAEAEDSRRKSRRERIAARGKRRT